MRTPHNHGDPAEWAIASNLYRILTSYGSSSCAILLARDTESLAKDAVAARLSSIERLLRRSSKWILSMSRIAVPNQLIPASTDPQALRNDGQEAPPSGVRTPGDASRPSREIIQGVSFSATYLRIRVHATQSPHPPGTPAPADAPVHRLSPVPSALSAPSSEAPFGGRQTEEVILPGSEQRIVLPGAALGRNYLRRRMPSQREASAFLPRGEQVFEATERTSRPESPIGRGYERVRRMLLGRRLTTAEQVHERLTKVKALAVLSWMRFPPWPMRQKPRSLSSSAREPRP